ncbi:hypothetical protein N2152v2_002423 [Parachlorella kessleri]
MTASSVPTVELLDVDNYATWRSKMKFLLITKGLWAAVVGDCIDRDKDAKALALIGLHVRDLHLPVLERCSTAKGAWEQLEAVYQAKSNARKRQLRKELSQLRMGAAEPLAKYVARAKEIQNQLRAAGYEVADQEVAWALLAGLSQAYETVVTVLETSSTEDVKLDDILPKLMSVEQRMYITKSPGPSEAALAAAAKRRNGFGGVHGQRMEQRTCHACGQVGHIAKFCLNERLCYNRQVLAGGQPLQPRHFPALAEAGTWTVQQLAALVHPQQPLPPPLQLVWDCLPADWRATALQPWQPEWELCAVAGLVRQVESGKLYSVCAANGGMEEAPDAALPLGALWVPCCVGFKHLPRQRQGGGGAASDSGSDSGSDSDSDSGAQESRRVPLLVGPWELVQVDPNAWGWGKKALLAFTVKSASVRRVQLRALRCLPGGRYQPKSGCRPKLWGPPPPPPGSPVPPTGLVVLETGWRHSYDTQPPGSGQRGVRRPAAEFEVGLLPCQAPGRRARLGVWERVSARHAAEPQPVPPSSATLVVLPDDTIDAAAPGDPDSAERCLWVEMRRADLPREQYIVLYRILHGSMYVGAFLHHISVIPRQQACCSHPACQGELETLSHAFTLCPAVAPAAAWVGRVIAAVAACPTPPPAPEVLLVGNGGGWVAPGDAHQVWLLLRGSFLHAVWQLRCRRSLTGQPFTALAVCAATVASVTSTLRRDWARVTQSLIGMSGMCPEWFRGRSPELALHAFRSRWAHRGVLCRVREGEGDAQPTIQLRFTLAHPCAPSPLASAPAVLPEPPPVQIGGPTA